MACDRLWRVRARPSCGGSSTCRAPTVGPVPALQSGARMAENPLPRRHTIRFQDFDYSQAACYFVTICSKDNRCIFGQVVHTKMQLNSLGKIIEECLLAVPRHFETVEIPVHAIMPNHLHAIVVLRLKASGTGPTKTSSVRAEGFAAPVTGSIPTIVRSSLP